MAYRVKDPLKKVPRHGSLPRFQEHFFSLQEEASPGLGFGVVSVRFVCKGDLANSIWKLLQGVEGSGFFHMLDYDGLHHETRDLRVILSITTEYRLRRKEFGTMVPKTSPL